MRGWSVLLCIIDVLLLYNTCEDVATLSSLPIVEACMGGELSKIHSFKK